MDANEGVRRAGDEDPDLVDCVVGWVGVAVAVEGHFGEREEECGGDALVDGVFANVDKEEGEHAVMRGRYGG